MNTDFIVIVAVSMMAGAAYTWGLYGMLHVASAFLVLTLMVLATQKSAKAKAP